MTEEIIAYKIFEQDKKGTRTLFHGLEGSRTLRKGCWLEADEKMVKDGTSKTQYLSGWHVLLNKKDAEAYMQCFTARLDKLSIVPVKVKDIRPKTHSRSPVFLAKHLKIEE